MKAKKGFNLRNICGEQIIVAEGKENIDFSNIISMNETSGYLWEQIQGKESFDENDLSSLLVRQYEVDKDTALKDSIELIKTWKQAGIIE